MAVGFVTGIWMVAVELILKRMKRWKRQKKIQVPVLKHALADSAYE